MTNMCGGGRGLWDEEDEFYYDMLQLPSGEQVTLRLRSLVGLIPLFAVEVLDHDILERLPEFRRRLQWVLDNRPQLAALVSRWFDPGSGQQHLLSLLRGHRMKRLLARMLDPKEFLSDYGIRGLSKVHEQDPYVFRGNGVEVSASYVPAESTTGLFGGNSNWRGPIWLPVNYLLVESLCRFPREPPQDDHRPPLQGLRSVLRVLSWRHRARGWRRPPDRMDRSPGRPHRQRLRSPQDPARSGAAAVCTRARPLGSSSKITEGRLL